jgi:hypothetical protein
MTFPQILEYLTHRGSHGPPDNHSSSCFDENQTPFWAYRFKNLGADVRRDPFVRARARLELPSGRNILHTGQVLSNIGLDLEIEGERYVNHMFYARWGAWFCRLASLAV